MHAVPTTLRLGTFTSPVLLHVARSIGALAEAGLVVEEHAAPSSPAQFRSLRSGELDAVLTNPDNVVAYRFVPDNPLGEVIDVRIVAAIDRGLGLTLCAGPGITTPTPGMRLGVDAPASGFALLAYGLLERLGITRESLTLEALGSTPARATALLAGSCELTMLNAGNELRALHRGCTALGSADELGPYLGTVIARLGSAPQEPVDELTRTLLDVARRIVQGELNLESAAVAERVLGLSPALAKQHVAVMRHSLHGLVPSGVVDAASVDTVLVLRERFLPSPALAEARAGWREMLTLT